MPISLHKGKRKKIRKSARRIFETLARCDATTLQEAECQNTKRQITCDVNCTSSRNRKNECASGISENVTEATQILGDFLHETREAKLEQKQAKDELISNESKLLKAGEEIQDMTLNRTTKKKDVAPSPGKRKGDEDADFSELMNEKRDEILENRTTKHAEIELRKRELDLQEKKMSCRRRRTCAQA